MEYSDKLELINGPEDGTEFPIVRTPIDAGRSQACGIQIRFDPAIRDRMVRITAVSEGYRVRRIERGRVWVNGRRVGRFRSRILRQGDTLQLGNSELHLSLMEEGLAQRSRGLATESDFGWGLRIVFQRMARIIRGVLRLVRAALGPLWWPLVFLVVLVLGIHWTFPGFFSGIWHQFWYWLGLGRYLLFRFMR